MPRYIMCPLLLLPLFLVSSLLPGVVAHRGNDNVRGLQSEPRRAWVALLTGNDYNITQLAATQIRSVESYSQYKHVTLILPTVTKQTRELLSSLPTDVLEVSPIHPPYEMEKDKDYWRDVFSKFNIFNMVDYDQVAFLDADAYIMKDGADRVFDLCEANLCGVRDNKMIGEWTFRPRPMVNAGMLVARPSLEVYDFIVNWALPQATTQYAYPEQGFITELYLETLYGEFAGDFQWLPWNYNTCSQGYYQSCLFLREETRRKCKEEVKEQAVIFHHCGVKKIDKYPLCVWEKDNDRKTEHEDPSAKKSREYLHSCKEPQVLKFQELLLDVNPCARGGRGEDNCLAVEEDRCHWCGDDIRCVPSSVDCREAFHQAAKVDERRALLDPRSVSGKETNFLTWLFSPSDVTVYGKVSVFPVVAAMASMAYLAVFSPLSASSDAEGEGFLSSIFSTIRDFFDGLGGGDDAGNSTRALTEEVPLLRSIHENAANNLIDIAH